MFFKLSRLIFIAILLTLTVICVNAQNELPDASTRSGKSNNREDFPKGIKESLAKSRIEREKKDYEELLRNGEEAVKLSESLEKSFTESNKLSAEDQKKLDRLEKLAKKIRRELGANDNDNVDEENPSSMLNAFKTLQSSTSELVAELKKTTRHSISVVAIQSSNAFLKVIKFIRFSKN
jgi:membrane-associated HD superfamily phosphohydrolase